MVAKYGVLYIFVIPQHQRILVDSFKKYYIGNTVWRNMDSNNSEFKRNHNSQTPNTKKL